MKLRTGCGHGSWHGARAQLPGLPGGRRRGDDFRAGARHRVLCRASLRPTCMIVRPARGRTRFPYACVMFCLALGRERLTVRGVFVLHVLSNQQRSGPVCPATHTPQVALWLMLAGWSILFSIRRCGNASDYGLLGIVEPPSTDGTGTRAAGSGRKHSLAQGPARCRAGRNAPAVAAVDGSAVPHGADGHARLSAAGAASAAAAALS